MINTSIPAKTKTTEFMGGYQLIPPSASGKSLRATSSDPVGPSNSASPLTWDQPPSRLVYKFFTNFVFSMTQNSCGGKCLFMSLKITNAFPNYICDSKKYIVREIYKLARYFIARITRGRI